MIECLLLQVALWLLCVAGPLSLLSSLVSHPLSIRVSGWLGVITSLLTAGSGAFALIHQSSFKLAIPGLQFLSVRPELTVDPLAAAFVFLIGLAGGSIALYSIGYLQAEYLKKPVGLMGALYHFFMLSMLLVVMASDALSFLVFWECMALLSFCLVIFDAQSADSRRAGFVYLVMTHIGTAFLLMMYLLLASQSGQFAFTSFAQQSAHLPIALKSLLFGLAVIGFGAKAGLIPLHIWLPEAHPAAPSHVSALMSGVMLKTAVYALLRCVFDFLSPFPEWWGVALAGMALLTALLGITYASVENDFKRLLAYSSIENMGVIFFAIGLAMVFAGRHEAVWVSLFLVAALFHCLNHAIFKSLLFMVAGSILSVAHTRSLENLGGLIHKMPVTAVLFLIGALAVSALPPLNGFLSEWLIFQGLILSTQSASDFLRVFLPLSAALLGLTGAIVAATFVKLFSGAFLAMPRSHHAQHAREVSPAMLAGMAVPALLCLLFGLTPSLTLPWLNLSVAYVSGASSMPAYPFLPDFYTILLDGYASYIPLLVFLVLVAGMAAAWMLPRMLGKRTALRREITWSCGVTPAPEFETSPTGFSQPLEVVFSKFHATVNGYHEYFYIPLTEALLAFSRRVSVIQAGKIQIYLSYMLLALLACLLWIK